MTLNWYQSAAVFIIIFIPALCYYFLRFLPQKDNWPLKGIYAAAGLIFSLAIPFCVPALELWKLEKTFFILRGLVFFVLALVFFFLSRNNLSMASLPLRGLIFISGLFVLLPLINFSRPGMVWWLYIFLSLSGLFFIFLIFFKSDFKALADILRLVSAYSTLLFLVFCFYFLLWKYGLIFSMSIEDYSHTFLILLALLIFFSIRPVEKKARIIAERVRGLQGKFLVHALSDLSAGISRLMEPAELAAVICRTISENLNNAGVGLFVDKPLYRLVRNNEECDAKVINSKKDEIFYPLYIYCRQPDKKGDTFLNRTEYIYRSMLDNHDSKEYYVMDLKIKSATKNDQKALIIIYRNFETDQEIHEALNAFAYHASSALSNSILYFNIKNLNFCLTRALENLEKTQKELVQSEKMAALGRLSAQIAHEVRNPLGTIKVSAVTLLENSNDNENMKTLSRFIACEVDRLNNVVSGLLDFSKVRSIKKQKVLLREFKEKLIHLVSHDMDKKNIHFSFDLNNYETAFFDYDSILQVLHNLVLNSIDALKESADALKESADALKESADENYKGTISILLEKQSDYFIFYVRDNGPGFKDDPQKAFEPFYTSKTRGTGLGLAVCRQIAELHGGTVRINDSTPTGACVVISLPV